jgi:hypothetical protein
MAILKKINDVMKRVRGVEKDSYNQHGKFKYAGHEAVNERLRDHFAELGIVRTAKMLSLQVLDGGTLLAECSVTYTDVEDDSSVVVPMWAVQPSQTSNKTLTAQQVGQALSYAVKNVEFKLFALTGDGEADSDSSEAYNPNEEPVDDSARKRAKELLKGFADAKSTEEVDAVNALFKKEWPQLKGVPNLAEAVVASRTSALKRIKGE